MAEVESGTKIAAEGSAATKLAGAALERIIGMAERVDRMIAQIAIATAQQAAAADQSSASLDAIHALSGENLEEMATTAQGVEALRGAAVAMERQVERSVVKRVQAWRGGSTAEDGVLYGAGGVRLRGSDL